VHKVTPVKGRQILSDGNHEEIKLTVAEARRQKDVGKSVARINRKAMEEIGVKQGDIVEIEESKNSAAIVRSSYREDEGLDMVRLDGLERKNTGSSIGEKVTVGEADVKEAERVTIAPTEEKVQIRGGGRAIKRSLLGRPASKEDLITPTGLQGDIFSKIFGGMFQEMSPSSSFGLGELRFKVTGVNPDGLVLITKDTRVKVSSQTVEVEGVSGSGGNLRRYRRSGRRDSKSSRDGRTAAPPPRTVRPTGDRASQRSFAARTARNRENADGEGSGERIRHTLSNDRRT